MIEAGACAIQIENQVSDEKQCGHQDGKVTVHTPISSPRFARSAMHFWSWVLKTALS